MRSCSLLFALLSFVACRPPEQHVAGSVASACDAKPAPLADAKIAVRCPDKPDALYVATTDARGRFDISATAPIPPTCSLEVTHDGFATRTYAFSDVCAIALFEKPGPGVGCSFAGVTAELQPAAGSQP